MTTLPKIVESKTKIRFQDCDPFNHLNNAAYLNYLINAREDQIIKHYDLDIYKMAKTSGIGWVTASNQIAYLKPALLMEVVTIDSQIINYDSTSLKVELRMWNEDKTKLKAVMWSSFVYFNLISLKREEHPKKIMNLFKNINNPIHESIFEERLSSFRKKK